MKAILKLRECRHPISEETIGFRLQAAIPNNQGGRFDKNGVSFRGKYLIAESSDVTELDAGTLDRFLANLKWKGFDEIVTLE